MMMMAMLLLLLLNGKRANTNNGQRLHFCLILLFVPHLHCIFLTVCEVYGLYTSLFSRGRIKFAAPVRHARMHLYKVYYYIYRTHMMHTAASINTPYISLYAVSKCLGFGYPLYSIRLLFLLLLR